MAAKRQLPLLDISLYYSNPSAFVEKLRYACHNVGFFLLKHDLPAGLADTTLAETRRFFERPLDEKLEISYLDSPSFRGYMQLGVENTAGKLDYREQIEYAVEYSKAGKWPAYERLKSANPWPENQPGLRQSTMDYATHVCRIANCIRKSLCLALNLEQDALSHLFQNPNEPPHWVIKLVSYPPMEDTQEQDSLGVGAHCDTNFLTLVLQDTVGGLQAFSQGQWLDVPSDLGGDVLVCNLGEQAEILSRGYFLATPHRVLANRCKRPRISVPLFYNPVLSATIEPIESIPESVSWDRPKNSEEKHWRRASNAMLSTVGDNTFKSLARSHPRVFQRNHPDLVLLEDGRILPKYSLK
jgi:isopenicillin N synthase-like dioxygenase